MVRFTTHIREGCISRVFYNFPKNRPVGLVGLRSWWFFLFCLLLLLLLLRKLGCIWMFQVLTCLTHIGHKAGWSIFKSYLYMNYEVYNEQQLVHNFQLYFSFCFLSTLIDLFLYGSCWCYYSSVFWFLFPVNINWSFLVWVLLMLLIISW